jgi:hypothetical protein
MHAYNQSYKHHMLLSMLMLVLMLNY